MNVSTILEIIAGCYLAHMWLGKIGKVAGVAAESFVRDAIRRNEEAKKEVAK